MTASRRLKICYVVPAHGLLSTAGPTRNVLNLARALEEWADVTVAFRRVLDERPPEDMRVLEIQPHLPRGAVVDDSAMRGLGLREFTDYLLELRRFTQQIVRRFDVILEKSWLLSGYLSAHALRHGGRGIPVENVVPSARRHETAGLAKRLRVEIGCQLAGMHLRQAPLIIAETEQLRQDIARHWRVRPERVEVVGLGVDRSLFRPQDQGKARDAVGICREGCVLLYVGALDETHNLASAIEAVALQDAPDLALHIVGDGPQRQRYEALARRGPGRVVFHGRVPHDAVPRYIAAADLCLAPYDARAFATGSLGYSTMKVPEYLSVGRPVASAPSARMLELLRHGETGFLFENSLARWQAFLADRPSRQRLAEMGALAARSELHGWDKTARRYLALCERLVAARAAAGD
ncbi:glycosyltransferase family 4 protein [Marinimicrococcus flavescens]|uniref:Glycosyltransferase family 4 protein n=1 Tax=Marinimicrococcus flavescens TaxID=3031815 RepID=A0AAP3XSU7_9PROT|nr:glycosyltransferase family 4 protein [Marinimicrococcus flavescens]